MPNNHPDDKKLTFARSNYTTMRQRLLAAQFETATSIDRLMVTIIAISLISMASLAFPDSYLLITETTVNVPLTGPASFKTFLLLAPFLLIIFRSYIEIYLLHWQRLDNINRSAISIRLPTISILRHRLLRMGSLFVVFPLIPITTGILAWKALVLPIWGHMLLSLTFAIVAALSTAPSFRSFLLHRAFLRPRLMLIQMLLVVFLTASFSYIIAGQVGVFRPFQLQMAALGRSNLRDANLRKADFHKANLEFADLWGANLEGSSMLYANLQGADLRDAILRKAYLHGVNLQMAYLRDADLQGADLEKANFCAAELQGANLLDVRNLTQEQMDLACGDKATRLPQGMTIKICGDPSAVPPGWEWPLAPTCLNRGSK